MKSRMYFIAMLLLMLAMTSGCAILKGPVLEALFPEPTSTNVPPVMSSEADEKDWKPSEEDIAPVERDGNATIEIINQSEFSICDVYVTSSEDDYWGDSILGSNEEIEPGGSFTYRLPDGPQDVLMQTCDEEILASEWEINASTTIVVGGEGLVPVVVNNQSKLEICYLYVADTNADYWDDDQLGQWETILPNGGRRIIFVEPGVYDFLVTDCDDQDIYWDNEINVDGPTEWLVDLNDGLPDHRYDYGGSDLTIILNNDTDMDWCYVHISPADADSWGADWLKPEEAIQAGDMKSFTLVAGVYDVSITDCNNSVVLTAWELDTDTTLDVSDEGKVALSVVNWMDEDICYVYIDPQGSSIVGESWLPGWEVIYGYSGKRVFYIAPDIYDLTFEDCSGNILDQASSVEIYEDTPWIVGIEDSSD